MEKKTEGDKEAVRLVKSFKKLIKKTNTHSAPDSDLKKLREMLKEHPELYQEIGDLASSTAYKLVDSSRATDAFKLVLLHDRRIRMKELGYEQASPLEKMIIEQVMLCWMRHNLVEYSFYDKMSKPHTLEQSLGWEKQMTISQQRFTRACESLARIRKLARNAPGLQVNIATGGGQQVNLAGELTMNRKTESREADQNDEG
ncbi:MAG: hypothetical protein U0Z53_24145 [Blastocatellia bacterium]